MYPFYLLAYARAYFVKADQLTMGIRRSILIVFNEFIYLMSLLIQEQKLW